MDWYYPILGGVLRGDAAQLRVAARLGHVRRRGPRRALRLGPPWVTAAETCELVMALDAIGADDRAARAVHLGAVPPPRRRRLLDRHELRRRALPRAAASSTPSSNRRGTPPPSCSPRTRSAARARPPGSSAARACPSVSRRGAHRGRRRDRGRARSGTPVRPRGVGRPDVAHPLRRAQNPEGAGRRDRREAVGDRALPHLERRLTAVGRVLEHVVEREHAARRDVRRPRLVVGERDVERVAAVDEEQPERRGPVLPRRSVESPITATTTSSSPASSIVRRKNGQRVHAARSAGRRVARRGAPTRPGSPPSRGGGRR